MTAFESKNTINEHIIIMYACLSVSRNCRCVQKREKRPSVWVTHSRCSACMFHCSCDRLKLPATNKIFNKCSEELKKNLLISSIIQSSYKRTFSIDSVASNTLNMVYVNYVSKIWLRSHLTLKAGESKEWD